MRKFDDRRSKYRVRRLNLEKGKEIAYNDDRLSRRFITDRGKIVPRRICKLSAKDMRAITRAIKRARQMALIPYVGE